MTRQTKNLWAPWRIGYLKGMTDAPQGEQESSCFLCDAATVEWSDKAAADRLLLLRDSRGMLLLNRYPYVNGHLLAAPPEHVADLGDMTAARRAGLMELAELGTRLLKATANPQGFNVGMNLGRCAGAGVPGHAHMHIVPRWHGDTNFMDVVGGVRVIPQALEEAYEELRAALAACV